MVSFVFLTLISFSLCLLLWDGLKALYSIWWKPKKLEKELKRQGIKGSSYILLYGVDLKEYINCITETWSKPINLNHQITSRVVPYVKNLVQQYGKVSLTWNGTTPRLIIMDPEMMKEVLSEKNGNIQKPPLNPLILMLAKGLTVLEGEEWSKHRRIISPAFHQEKLKGMMPAFSTSCIELIERWKMLVDPAKGSCELDVWPEMGKLTADVISRTAFGSNYEEGKRLFELQKEQILLVVEAMQMLYIPGYRFIPTKKNKRRQYLAKEINGILRGFISKREELMKTDSLSSTNDLLGLLLQSSHSESYGLTIEDVIEECKVFYSAGQETNSTLLTWAIVVLAMHPNWQEKAREEVERICGKNVPDFKDITHFKIMTMILNEVLRLYPPVVEVYRHTCKRTKLGDTSIPAGVDLTLPILLIHHDKEYWGDDAEEFKPERFADGVMNASKDNRASFFPFGWGPKVCIGQNFAMIEAKMALAMILQNFSLELPPSYAHAPYTVMTLQPQHGAQIIPHQL
ncbi:cytochrome P450 72A15-like [Papaver somniferum]|uniref:cytochrome P450 72A15-like n=1 Tax=Papaver somniferum TaxID=3469 RepID=UPI000E6FA4CC|nr:cytochrome P450 72A15-like [Papaver somniferum]